MSDAKTPRPPSDRGQGRKPLPPELKTKLRSVRLTPVHWSIYDALGGAQWMRETLDAENITLERSEALKDASSIGHAAEIVTHGSAIFTPEELAGQYAWEAAIALYGRPLDVREHDLSAHLELLQHAGARVDWATALKVACRWRIQAIISASQAQAEHD